MTVCTSMESLGASRPKSATRSLQISTNAAPDFSQSALVQSFTFLLDSAMFCFVPSPKRSIKYRSCFACCLASTLRDARKLGLLPSVTNILGVITKPELTAWLQEQAVLAALTLPRLEG